MERVTLTQKELKRVKILERLFGGSMSSAEAAEILGVTCRQLRRLKSKYAQEGEKGLIHGNRGRKPQHALPQGVKTEVLRLFEEKYSDSNFCHCSELLEEREGIKLSPSSIGRILKSAGKESKRAVKRRPKKHRRRERRVQAGMLWQTDATPYEWLGAEVGKFALHAVIDDATGIVVGASFTEHECALGYTLALQEGIRKYGLPLALYSDKHTIFRSPKEKLTIEQELDGEQIPLSNLGKALAELGIEHIKANTPQAKGRVERLWETLQDRLPVELRLLGIRSIEEANKALAKLIERHNRKYSVRPAEEKEAYIALETGVNLDYVFATRTTRKIGGGEVISYRNETYVPAESAGSGFNTKAVVEVRETFSGEVLIWHNGKAVILRKIMRPETSSQREKKPETSSNVKTRHKPAANHPWRKGYGETSSSVQASGGSAAD
jgi:transposase